MAPPPTPTEPESAITAPTDPHSNDPRPPDHSREQSELEVRLGGIYALEQYYRDVEVDRERTLEVIAAFVRSNLPPRKPLAEVETRLRPAPLPVDLQAALSVLGTLKKRFGDLPARIGLAQINTSLEGRYRAQLSGADLSGAALWASDLTGAELEDAVLSNANLNGANLGWARMERADLSGATLIAANLADTELARANLRGAHLHNAWMTNADLADADLTHAVLRFAKLSGTDFSGADLTSTKLSLAEGLTDEMRSALTADQEDFVP